MTPEDLLLYLISRSGKEPERLVGRKKLMKLAFFAEHYDPDSGSLVPESQLGHFDFEIFKYGPFSKGVLDAFDELEREGEIEEDDQTHLHNVITTTRDGSEAMEVAGRELDPEVRTHLDEISEVFGDETGAQLETKSLNMLDIEKREKEEYRGIPMEDIIERRAA